MDNKKIKDFFKKYSILIMLSVGITILIVLGNFFSSDSDNSENKNIELDLSPSIDMSEGKSVTKTSKNNLEMKDNKGTLNQGNTYTTTIYQNSKEDESIDVVYYDINITGRVVNKDNINIGIPDIFVELVSPYFSTKSKKDGYFYLYRKKPTYVDMGQIRVKETGLYKKYNNDFDLNAKKIRVKLEKK